MAFRIAFSRRTLVPAILTGGLAVMLWAQAPRAGAPKPNESIGAIAIAPSDPNIVYIGSGEANNRQSSSIGDGVWGTTDGGKTWNHLGLDDTQSIARIVVDPTNPKIVYVAAN